MDIGWYALPNLTSVSKQFISKNPIQITTHHHYYTNLKHSSSFLTNNQHAFPSNFNKQHQFITFAKNGATLYQSAHKSLLKFLIGSIVVLTVGYGGFTFYLLSLETIPFSKRTRLSITPIYTILKRIKVKPDPNHEILPATHPVCVRVGLIAKNIFTGFERGLKSKKNDPDPLEWLKWEVLVVNDVSFEAYSNFSGLIIMSSGLLELCESDAEVATVIAHEVGHIVAQHSIEDLRWVVVSSILPKSHKLAFLNKRLQRYELEADYIGLLLMAYAGYDPQVAPKFYEKMERVVEDPPEEGYSSHPTWQKRVEALNLKMEEALAIYRQVEVLDPISKKTSKRPLWRSS